MVRKFQRARKPEEKEVRRQAILAAARRLLDEVGAEEMSLSELARRAKLSKANMYRYFESREEVLLQIWIEEIRDLNVRLATSLPDVPAGNVPRTARAIVAAFVARPPLCALMATVSALERNLSVDAIVRAKLALAELAGHIATELHARLPKIPLADCGWAASMIATHVAGAWQGAHPRADVAEVFERPELRAMKPDFERELTRFIEVLFTGLLAPTRATLLGG